jgi:hypothetical protein
LDVQGLPGNPIGYSAIYRHITCNGDDILELLARFPHLPDRVEGFCMSWSKSSLACFPGFLLSFLWGFRFLD